MQDQQHGAIYITQETKHFHYLKCHTFGIHLNNYMIYQKITMKTERKKA